MGPYQVLPLRARVDLGAMAMKEDSTFYKAPVAESAGTVEYTKCISAEG